jgi:hypothetical protein
LGYHIDKKNPADVPWAEDRMEQAVNVNRKYKSSVFASYFSDAEKLIEAYNARLRLTPPFTSFTSLSVLPAEAKLRGKKATQ